MQNRTIAITKENILLRPWKETDAPRLAQIANNKRIADNLRDGFPFPYSLEHAKQFISSVKDTNPESIVLAIEVNGIVAGSIGAFFKQDVHRKNAEIGYYLAEEYWGKGVMTKSISALIEFIFNNYDIIRIFAEPYAKNTGSRKVLEKVGFRLEGVQKCGVIKNGVIEDSCIYAILKEEFSSESSELSI